MCTHGQEQAERDPLHSGWQSRFVVFKVYLYFHIYFLKFLTKNDSHTYREPETKIEPPLEEANEIGAAMGL